MKKLFWLLLLVPVAVLVFAQPNQGGGPFPNGSGSINTNAYVGSTNSSATNLTQYFNKTTTNFLNTGTVYWVWNGNLPLFSANAAGQYIFYNGIIGDGSGLTNLAPTAMPGALTNGNTFNVSLGGGTWTFGNNLLLTNVGGVIGLTNVAGTGRGTVAASFNGNGVALKGALSLEYLSASTLGVLVSNSVPFRVDDAGNVTISNGTIVATVGVQAPYWNGYMDSRTNNWTTNTPFILGVTNAVPVLSVNTACGITDLTIPASANNNDTKYGSMNIQTVSGNVTFTNPANFKTSDFVSSRVITNGNTLKITIEWQKGLCTNMYLVQCH